MKKGENAESGANDYEHMTIGEVARTLRFSVDTLKRYMRAGKLKDIEWVDFLGNGKLRATRASVDAFVAAKTEEMRQVINGG